MAPALAFRPAVSGRHFAERIRAAARRRGELISSSHTNAYRVFHAQADGVPDVTVDWFDGVAVCSLYSRWDESAEREWVDAVACELEARAVYLKRRPRQASRLAPRQVTSFAPQEPAFGQRVSEHTVLESDLCFRIRPAAGLAVGLYLDMRDTRRWLYREARSKVVLNCFAYTCAFAVYAREGGAKHVVNVDLSRGALDWGAENARLNGQPVERESYLCGDAFDWLRRLGKREERFDLIILDPPSFATSKRSRFSARRDWPRLAAASSLLVNHGGRLLACCNQASLSAARFEEMMRRGFERVSRRATLIARLCASPLDFPPLPGRSEALKVLAYELD